MHRTKIQFGVQGFGSNQKNELYYNSLKWVLNNEFFFLKLLKYPEWADFWSDFEVLTRFECIPNICVNWRTFANINVGLFLFMYTIHETWAMLFCIFCRGGPYIRTTYPFDNLNRRGLGHSGMGIFWRCVDTFPQPKTVFFAISPLGGSWWHGWIVRPKLREVGHTFQLLWTYRFQVITLFQKGGPFLRVWMLFSIHPCHKDP